VKIYYPLSTTAYIEVKDTFNVKAMITHRRYKIESRYHDLGYLSDICFGCKNGMVILTKIQNTFVFKQKVYICYFIYKNWFLIADRIDMKFLIDYNKQIP
jgi:hypothetical protein